MEAKSKEFMEKGAEVLRESAISGARLWKLQRDSVYQFLVVANPTRLTIDFQLLCVP
jgi:hypothetical protein